MNAPEHRAAVKVRPGVSVTEYRIVGSLEAVFQAIGRVFEQFSPVGYGTRVHEIECDYPKGDVYIARMSRSNSAD